MMTQQDVIDSLPVHLQPFVAYQDYERYTPRDHAVWRFLLHQLRDNLSRTAHPIYREGLARTGITLEAIPRVEEINRSLNELGWRAVVVDGFVPPAIFMEFQAHQVLAIAVDMRSIDHMLYTPAPDIVHESAGHAPFIIDTDYAEFLQRFGELGMHAVASRADMDVYEAVRHLSIVKEAHGSTAAQIRDAEQRLEDAIAANDNTSEASMLARLHWWTVEYGLVGTPDDYRIFGAGLLSSLGESSNCLDDSKVRKLPLTVDAVARGYDITREQPQLYVARNCRHLSQVLEIVGDSLCVNRGGAGAVEKAIDAGTVNTAVTNSGLEISGIFTGLRQDAVGNPIYINTTGPTQLAFAGRELPGHGCAHHSDGFGSPVGRLQAMERCLSSYTVDELTQQGIEIGQQVTLDFLSGIRVSGELCRILRRRQRNLVFTFRHCRVTDVDGASLFTPDQGIYEMAVGDAITSLYGGSADQEAFPLYKKPPAEGTLAPSYDSDNRARFACYAEIRRLRDADPPQPQAVLSLMEGFQQIAGAEWLLYFELLELAVQSGLDVEVWGELADRLEALAATGSEDQARLINYGLQRAGIREWLPVSG